MSRNYHPGAFSAVRETVFDSRYHSTKGPIQDAFDQIIKGANGRGRTSDAVIPGNVLAPGPIGRRENDVRTRRRPTAQRSMCTQSSS